MHPLAPAPALTLCLLAGALACVTSEHTSDTSGELLTSTTVETTVPATGDPDPTTDELTTGAPATTTTTTDSTTTDSTAADACAAEPADACEGCMQDICCEALAACQADAACLACVLGEDSEACESTPETHARVDAYLECKGGGCQAECIGDPVGSCEDALAELRPDACTTCLGASCCDELAACHGDAICWTGCFTRHDEATCHSDPDGHALYHALGACAQASCATECA